MEDKFITSIESTILLNVCTVRRVKEGNQKIGETFFIIIFLIVDN